MKYQIALLYTTLFISCISCRKMVDTGSPKNQLTPDKVFNDKGSAEAAAAALYTNLGNADASFITPAGVYTDELISFVTDQYSGEFSSSVLTAGNTNLENIWQYLYFTIYKANSLLEGLHASTDLPDALRSQYIGEALFIRAYCHFTLANIFGPVPLVTSTDAESNTKIARASVDSIFSQAILDLKDAVAMLPEQYPGDGQKIRANKWAATALLAKVYLYNNDFANAEASAGQVIGSGQYSLVDLNGIFKVNSDEAILQIWNQYGYTPLSYTPGSEMPPYQVAPSLLVDFEANDKRKDAWINSTVVSGNTYLYPYKYKNKAPVSGAGAEYAMYIRLGETYLVRAEARAQQEHLTDAAADLDTLRSRAGLGATTAATKTDMLSAIWHERRIELFTEGGNRFFDLRRSGTINTVLAPLKPFWKPAGALFPVPQQERLRDPNLTQNEGYDF